MSEQGPSEVMGALPRRRPHRRSAKRPAPAQTGSPPPSNGTEAPARRTAASRAPGDRARGSQAEQSARSAPATRSKQPANAKAGTVRDQDPLAAASATEAADTANATASTASSTSVPTPPGAEAGHPHPLPQPPQPAGVPSTPRTRPDQPGGRHLLGTAAQAAAELAEIGLSVGARALRGMVDRLPRP